MSLKYFEELKKAMNYLASQPNTLFLGQAVACKGTGMSNTLVDIDLKKRLELPVCEEMQMGMTNGLALQGIVPISIFPRWNFLMCAVNQLVNHLDKIKAMSDGQFIPKAIIRTAIGSERPLHPQSQHIGDFSDAFRLMLQNVDVVRLSEPDDILPEYEKAYAREDGKSTILVEYGDYYNEK